MREGKSVEKDDAIYTLERLAHTEAKWPGTEETLEALDMAVKALRMDHFREATNMVPGVWISVADRLPHLREDVLVCAYWHEKWSVYTGWTNGKRWYVGCGCGTVSGIQVSHWMPLPKPPET